MKCGGQPPIVLRDWSVEVLNLVDVEENLKCDARWQLIERIVHTEPFKKSTRLPGLLRYLAERSINGHLHELTEQRIGTSVFGKPADYSPAEDSAVRVHVRQLRLRLHEYFDSEGRDETLIVDIPKGSYSLVFHSGIRESASPIEIPVVTPVAEARKMRMGIRQVFPWLAMTAALICALGWYHAHTTMQASRRVPWPLNTILQDDQQTAVVLGDCKLMLRLSAGKEIPLQEFLNRDYLKNLITPGMPENEARLINYIAESQLTSYANVFVATTLVKLAGPHSDQLVIRGASDLNPRELEHGNYIFIGSSASNPWVSLFENNLNFEVVEDSVGGKTYFRNKKPRPGEQSIYQGLEHTGSAGEDFATISFLPNSRGRGSVLILQGLMQEGTEAAGLLLADAAHRAKLEQAIGVRDNPQNPTYFEALIRARSVAGAPVSVDIVSTRIINP
jgi:hypothetical protein